MKFFTNDNEAEDLEFLQYFLSCTSNLSHETIINNVDITDALVAIIVNYKNIDLIFDGEDIKSYHKDIENLVHIYLKYMEDIFYKAKENFKLFYDLYMFEQTYVNSFNEINFKQHYSLFKITTFKEFSKALDIFDLNNLDKMFKGKINITDCYINEFITLFSSNDMEVVKKILDNFEFSLCEESINVIMKHLTVSGRSNFIYLCGDKIKAYFEELDIDVEEAIFYFYKEVRDDLRVLLNHSVFLKDY